MKLGRLLVAALAACYTTGCATILSGKTQTITIASNPPGAICELTRQAQVVGKINPTPGAAMVTKTKYDITVLCKKDGYQDATAYLKSGTEGSTFGNILLGGVVGWGIDSASGADNKYPDVTTVSLVPVENPAPAQKSASKVAQLRKTAAVAPKKEGVSERLKNLEDLKAKNQITEADYDSLKKKILAEL